MEAPYADPMSSEGQRKAARVYFPSACPLEGPTKPEDLSSSPVVHKVEGER